MRAILFIETDPDEELDSNIRASVHIYENGVPIYFNDYPSGTLMVYRAKSENFMIKYEGERNESNTTN